jgi:hypothetical protein
MLPHDSNTSDCLFQRGRDVAVREGRRTQDPDHGSCEDRKRWAELLAANATVRRQEPRPVTVALRGDNARKIPLTSFGIGPSPVLTISTCKMSDVPNILKILEDYLLVRLNRFSSWAIYDKSYSVRLLYD